MYNGRNDRPRNEDGPIISEDTMKKIIVSVLVLVLVCSLFTGCILEKYEPKDFRCGDLEIELHDGFEKIETGHFLSKNMGVRVEEYAFDKLEGLEDMDEEAFAEMLVETLEYSASVKQDRGLLTISYEKEAQGRAQTYYSVVYKSDEAFWTVTFYTFSESFEEMKDTIRDYAWTVEF